MLSNIFIVVLMAFALVRGMFKYLLKYRSVSSNNVYIQRGLGHFRRGQRDGQMTDNFKQSNNLFSGVNFIS